MLLVLVTIVRARRRGLAFAGAYGAGGTTSVPAGSDGFVKQALTPLGVVYTVGEEWSARSSSGRRDRPRAHASASSARKGLRSSSNPDGPASDRPAQQVTT